MELAMQDFANLPPALQAMYAVVAMVIGTALMSAFATYMRTWTPKAIEVFDSDLDGKVTRIEVMCRGVVTPGTWVQARVFGGAAPSGNSKGLWLRLYAFREHGSHGEWKFSTNGPVAPATR
jgi:hypothetical protein